MEENPKYEAGLLGPRIALVGGGVGGLLTAWRLECGCGRPPRATIFEAAGRLGGKVLTSTFAAAPIRYEAGAAEFYDYTPVGDDPLRRLVTDLGLPTVPLGGAAVILEGESIANLDDVEAVLGPAARRDVEAFDSGARAAMTRPEFYASDERCPALPAPFAATIDQIRDPQARRYVETLIHSDLATEAGRTSVGYGLQNYLMNDPAYMRLYGIAGGNEQLVTALVERLAAEVRLESPVRAVRALSDGRFALSVDGHAGAAGDPFDAVVMALPIQHLAAIRFEGEELANAMRRHVARFDHPGHYLRVSCLFTEPFWQGRIDGQYVMLDAFGGCCLYDESARDPAGRHGVLGWLLAGAAAAALSERDDDAIVAAAIDALPPWFGDACHHLIEARVHRWTGAVSGLPGGWRPPIIDRRHQPDPVGHPRLFVVGDYLFDSTLNGVSDSAEHVAGWIAAEFG